jgi:restriction system protein
VALAAIHTSEILPAFGRILLLIWPFWLLLAGFGLFRLAVRQVSEQRLRASGIFDLDRMSAGAFDERISRLFAALGYAVDRVGVDMIVARHGYRAVVQPAQWSEAVDSDAVRKANAARRLHGADAAWVVTNRDFTKQALQLASRTGVDLWNRERLVASLRRANG